MICSNCGNNTYEGKPDEKGVWHYRCQYCVDHADPNGLNPCPKCGCTAHTNICGSWTTTSYGLFKMDRDINNKLMPDVTIFECLNCWHRWETPEYEKYLLEKNVLSMKVQ